MNTTTDSWSSWRYLQRVNGRQRPRPACDRLWAAVCGDGSMGRVQTLPYHKTLCGGCVPQLPLLINAQMGRWTEGAKIVRDKAVLSRPQTPPRNAGRGCGFETISTAFPYLFGGTCAITFLAV